jgi:hypothetical protein
VLFFIAAEQSLIERQKRVNEVSASANELLDLQCSIRHLPAKAPVDDEALSSEENSIKARDLFGKKAREDAGFSVIIGVYWEPCNAYLMGK